MEKMYIEIERQKIRKSGLVINDIKGNLCNLPEYKTLGSYIQPISEINNAIDGEFAGNEEDFDYRIILTPVWMEEEEYKKIPEFTGW